MLLSTRMMLSKANAVFQILGFCPRNKNFDIEDINAAAFSTINHTTNLEDGLKIARCYAANKSSFKKMVKAVSRHYDEFFGMTSQGKNDMHFTNYSDSRYIFHVSNALTNHPNTSMAIGRNMQVESSYNNEKYYFRRDMTYYVKNDIKHGSDVGLYNRKGELLCYIHMTPGKEVVLQENKTNFLFETNGDSTLIYAKDAKRKVPIGLFKWDSLSADDNNCLVRIEIIDSHANYEQLLHIGLATMLIFKSVRFSEHIMSAIEQI